MTAAAAVTAMPLVIDSQGGRKNATTPGRPTGSGREVGDFHVSVALQLRAAGDGRTQRGQISAADIQPGISRTRAEVNAPRVIAAAATAPTSAAVGSASRG